MSILKTMSPLLIFIITICTKNVLLIVVLKHAVEDNT